jgi:hypothetical protein
MRTSLASRVRPAKGTFRSYLAFAMMMQYREIECALVEGAERGVWNWSASVAGVVIVGHAPSKSAAVAAAEKAIDRAFRHKGTVHRLTGGGMSKGEKQQTSDVLRILHGARSLPPAEAAEALRPFLESMRKSGLDDALARASIAAVTELARSLKENHAASDDLWQDAIEATLSFANEVG